MGIYETLILVYGYIEGDESAPSVQIDTSNDVMTINDKKIHVVCEWQLREDIAYKYNHSENTTREYRYNLRSILKFLPDINKFTIPTQQEGCKWYVINHTLCTLDGFNTSHSINTVEYNVNEEILNEEIVKILHNKKIHDVFLKLSKKNIDFYSEDDRRFVRLQEIKELIEELEILCPEKFVKNS